jgi:hypothetical protein
MTALSYECPPGVAEIPGDHPVLRTTEDGAIALDAGLMALWRLAQGQSLDQVRMALKGHADLAGIELEALACLAEAGLLRRLPARTVVNAVI